jgi:hypothetical protein
MSHGIMGEGRFRTMPPARGPGPHGRMGPEVATLVLSVRSHRPGRHLAAIKGTGPISLEKKSNLCETFCIAHNH